jgi:heptaprenyl diphosphate synthase
MRYPTNKLALSGVLTALAAIFSYVEAMIPFAVGVPGIKLGLANVVIVFALYRMGPGFAFLVSVARILVVSSLFGSLAIAMYSLAGGLLSLGVMTLLLRTKLFSVIGVSMAGGVFHNIGQLVVAAAVVETFQILYYFPVLLIAGMITGIIIGIIVKRISRSLPPVYALKL